MSESACDFNSDGVIDLQDFALFSESFENQSKYNKRLDLYKDKKIDSQDF
ncbi:dockerin type I domain-containing protein [candidate division KSB1 bacterium]